MTCKKTEKGKKIQIPRYCSENPWHSLSPRMQYIATECSDTIEQGK